MDITRIMSGACLRLHLGSIFRISLIAVILYSFLTPSISSAQDRDPDPGIPDTVYVESKTLPAGTTEFTVEVTLRSDEVLMAFDIPLTWDSPDITLSTVSWVGSPAEFWLIRAHEVDAPNRQFHAGALAMFEDHLQPGSHLLFTAVFSVAPGASNQVINIDSLFYPPASELYLTLPSTFDIYPQFVAGEITLGNVDDGDNDGVVDSEDNCPLDYNPNQDDADTDGVGDVCDICEGFDDNADSDTDGVPDGCDICEGFDDNIDTDLDGVPDGCDICEGFDDNIDTDLDGVPDGCDICEGFDDNIDTDLDGVPDGCDICEGFDDNIDTDTDGVPDGCDICEGFDDNADSDTDGVPDGCDICEGFDDNIDSDVDGVPDGCDICEGFDDNIDTDTDGVPDGCDICEGFDDNADSDTDGVPDGCDNCPDDSNPLQEDADDDGIGDVCDYLCGDANSDGTVNLGDASFNINRIFYEGPDPDPLEAGDANGDGSLNLADASYIINWIFYEGPIPVCP